MSTSLSSALPEMPQGPLLRAITIIEAIAEAGSSTAREISEQTSLPLPTVYRMTRELCDVDYLVHLREEKRFALGYRLHALAVRLHEDLGVGAQVKREIAGLHQSTEMAAYLAIHRGADFVVVFVADSPKCPRIRPMRFGFRENPHATAFGKLGLAETPREKRVDRGQTLPALTSATITDPVVLDDHLDSIAEAGIAWEYEEFCLGQTCVAVPLRSASGSLIGSVAVSAPSQQYTGQKTHIEHVLRSTAARAGRYYRLGRS